MERVRTRLKTYWKWFLKIDEFLKIYKNRDMNEFFLCMCFLGGIVCTRKVNGILKTFWWTIHILLYAIIVSLNIYGFSNSKEINISTILMILRPISTLFVISFTQLAFCYFYENLEKYVNELDEYLDALPHHQNDKRYFHNVQFFDKISILLLCIIFWMEGFRFYFPTLQEFENQSNILKVLTSVALVFVLFYLTVFWVAGQKMRYIFLKGMMYVADDLIQQMRISSKSTMESLEMSHNQELDIEEVDLEQRNNVAHLFEEQRNKICKNFEENIVYFAKQQRKIVRIHLRLKTFFEVLSSSIVLRTCSFLVILGSDIFQTLYHPNRLSSWTVTALLFILIVVIDFNAFCLIGTTLYDLVERSSFEAYSCPWYLFPKKSRKMVSLLMIQFQIPHQLRAFGMFPFDVSLVPQVLQLTYSYVSVLQVILERSK